MKNEVCIVEQNYFFAAFCLQCRFYCLFFLVVFVCVFFLLFWFGLLALL